MSTRFARRVAVLVIGHVVALGWMAGRDVRAQGPQPSRRPAEFGFVIEKDAKIPMRDGVRLAADVYRPARDGKPVPGRFPTLLTRTPYDKNGVKGEGTYYAERGYVVVANDIRGRYASEGTWRLIVDDPQDGLETVEWIARQEWSDGKVGTFGTSYPGGTQHALAEMNPPHLTTMVPIDAVSNCGVSGMRHGGAFELRFMNWIFQIGAPNSRSALANPALRQALTESGRRIREHTDSLPVRTGQQPLACGPGVRGLAGRGDAERTRVPVLAHQGDVGRRPRGRLRRRPGPPHHRLVRLVDPTGHDELPGAREGQEIAPEAGDRTLGPRQPGLQRLGRGRVHPRRRDRPAGLPTAMV